MGEQDKNAFLVKKITQGKIDRLLTEESWSRAALAKLRRGVGKQPGELPELFEIILGDMPEELYGKGDGPSYAEWAIYTALTLLALHQQGKNRPMNEREKEGNSYSGNSLGAAVGLLARKNKEQEPAIKRRFDAVATAIEFTELTHHARGIIQLLKAGDITLDYPRLAEDLFWYQFGEVRNRVRLRWGEDYYRITQLNELENGGEENEES